MNRSKKRWLSVATALLICALAMILTGGIAWAEPVCNEIDPETGYVFIGVGCGDANTGNGASIFVDSNQRDVQICVGLEIDRCQWVKLP